MLDIGKLSEILKKMEIRTTDITGSVLVSSDGMPVCPALKEEIDENMIAAMCATLVNIGERATETLNKGEFKMLFIQGTEGFFVISKVTPSLLLGVLAKKGARIGVVLYEIERAKGEIRSSIES